MSYNAFQGTYNYSSDTTEFGQITIGNFRLTASGVYCGNKQIIDRFGNLVGLNAVINQISNISTSGLFTGVRQTSPQATLDIAGTGNFLGNITCASTVSALAGSFTSLNVTSIGATNANFSTLSGVNINATGTLSCSGQLINVAGGSLSMGLYGAVYPAANGALAEFQSNFDGSVSTAARGLAFRVDTRDGIYGGQQFAWLSRPAGSNTSSVIAYLTDGGNMRVSGTFSAPSGSISSFTCATITAGSYVGLNPTFVGSGSSLVLTNTTGTHLTLINPSGGGTNSFASIDFAGYGSPQYTNGAPMSLRFMDDYNYGGILSIRGKIDGAASNSQTEQYRFAGGNFLTNNSASAGSTSHVGSVTNTFSLLTYPSSSGGGMSVDSTGLLNIGQWGTTTVQVGTYTVSNQSNTQINQYGTWTTSASGSNSTAFYGTTGVWSGPNVYSSLTGAYTGTNSTTFVGGSVTAGEWWQISTTIPYYFQQANVTFFEYYVPQKWILAACNDGASWVNLGSATFTGTGNALLNPWVTSISGPGNVLYSYFRIVAPSMAPSGYGTTYNTAIGLQSAAFPGQPVVPLPPISFPSAISIRGQNVGFSNSSPSYTLDVAGTARTTGNTVLGNVINVIPNTYVSAAGVYSTANNCVLFDIGGTGTTTFWDTVDVHGNLGVYNPAPIYPVDVIGQGRFVSNNANQLILLNTSTTNTSDACEVKFDRTAGTSTAVSALGVGAGGRNAYWWVNGSDRINVTPTGAVGINTSVPGYTLDVNGNFHCSYAYIGGGSLSGLFNFSQSGQNGFSWNGFSKIYDDGDLRIATDDNMHFYTGLTSSSIGTEYITISGGNVGINKPGPSYQLDVVGSVQWSQGSSYMRSNGGYTQWYRSDSNTADGLFDFYSDVGGAQTNIARITCAGSFYNKTGTYNTLSDQRKKKNITDARKYLDSLCKLRVRKYSWQDSDDGNTPTQLGFLAQEIEQVMPGLVDTMKVDDLDDFKSVKTSVLIPMLVSAVQELQARLQAVERLIPQTSA